MNAPGPLPFERLVLIDDPVPRDGALNMALDEVLLDGLVRKPLLRIYRWQRPAVSIGCFDLFDAVLLDWPEHEIVRRWTGGGIVEHGKDLTFSLLVPRPLPLAVLPAAESYRVIHTVVAAAFAGVSPQQPTLQINPPEGASVASKACFENPVMHDLLVSGRKIVGGAQRRTRRGLLHQGSIQNSTSDSQCRLAGLADALPEVFGRNVEPRRLTEAELAAGRSLSELKYAAASWLRRF